MDGLAGDAQGLCHGLPGPPEVPSPGDLERFEPIGELAQGPDGPKACGGVVSGSGLDQGLLNHLSTLVDVGTRRQRILTHALSLNGKPWKWSLAVWDAEGVDTLPATRQGTVRVVKIAAGGLAVAYAFLGVLALAFLLPFDQTSSAGPGALSALIEHGTGWWLAARWLFLLTALLGLGLVVGLRRGVPPDRAAMGDWAAAVGGLGFVAVAVEQVRLISHVPGLVRAVAASPDRAREIANLSFVNLTDRYGLLTFGAVGLWLLVTSLLLLPASAPTWLVGCGVLAAAVFLTVAVFEGTWTSVLAAVGALTVAPLFFGGLAILIGRWPQPAATVGADS